jgi:hypothetical protein
MRRFTILSLMGVVLGVAVAAAALRSANNYWAGGLLAATVILIGTAALGAVYSAGSRRAARLGFVIFAAGYFALAFLGLFDQIRAMLPTTRLLTYIHDLAASTPIYPGYIVSQPYFVTQPGQFATFPSNNSAAPPLVFGPAPGAPAITPPIAVSPSGDASNGWNLLLPGAANYEAFNVVGHCLFTLLAGLLGAVVALRCQAKQTRLRDQAN